MELSVAPDKAIIEHHARRWPSFLVGTARLGVRNRLAAPVFRWNLRLLPVINLRPPIFVCISSQSWGPLLANGREDNGRSQGALRTMMIRRFLNSVVTIAFVALNISCKLVSAAPVQIGVLSDSEHARDPAGEWAWALRGGGAEIVKLAGATLASIPATIKLIVIDDIPLTPKAQRLISDWTKNGGLLIVSGANTAMQTQLKATEIRTENDFVLREILGARFGGWDLGILRSYPYVVQASELISPLLPGDGLRLGKAGVDSSIIVESDVGNVLARSVRLDPNADPDGVVRLTYPTILRNQAGHGWTVFLTVSLARVTSCYPTPDGVAVDCSASSTARAIMRWLTVNLLWEKRGVQLPLPWEIPSERPHGVLVTGDVHDDTNDGQIRSARLMAELLEPTGIPFSLFIEGRLGTLTPDHIKALLGMNHVEIEAHSTEGSIYGPRTKKRIVGATEVLSDTIRARRLLGVRERNHKDGGLTAMRTHGWGTDSAAWLGLHKAGVGLVLDQMSDLPAHKDYYTPPLSWLRSPIASRLFIPLAERSISTASDDFILPEALTGKMFSIPSPQCDPCCNEEVSWDDYQAYVENYHLIFDRIAPMGGLPEVWLFHPSTPAAKGGLHSLIDFLSGIRAAPGVSFLRGNAFATWLSNRENVSVTPDIDGSGKLSGLHLQTKRDLLPLPPDSSPDYQRVYYWILGEGSSPGWKASVWKDPHQRTVTVLHAPIDSHE